MSKSIVPASLALLFALAAAGAVQAQKHEPQLLSVTNTTEQVAFCTLIFDGKARTELAIRPGKTWSESFDPRRNLQLVCRRSKTNAFGPLEPGKAYRFVPSPGRKIDIAEGAAG